MSTSTLLQHDRRLHGQVQQAIGEGVSKKARVFMPRAILPAAKRGQMRSPWPDISLSARSVLR